MVIHFSLVSCLLPVPASGRPKARHSSAEESEGVATRRREREKGTRGDGSLGEVQRRSPVPVRRSKRLLTKKT